MLDNYSIDSFISFCDNSLISEESILIPTDNHNTFNRFKRSKSICETIDHNAVHLTKQNARNGIIIFYTERYTCVISDRNRVNNIPLFLLIKEFTVQDEKNNPYEHWTHVIGKQVKKDKDSKYFIQNEKLHFNNGRFDKNNSEGLEALIQEAERLIRML